MRAGKCYTPNQASSTFGLLFHRGVAYNLKKMNFELVGTNSFVLFRTRFFQFSCTKAWEVVSYSQNQITYQLSLRVGLAQEKTSLRTTGIYRISRNPMLFGLYLMALGSAIYVQNPINWLLVIIALVIHHKIILAEEISMQNRFEEQWTKYCNSVRRYL
jgi:protein-S-isoprenylcysteine O-methyltransferase Ste14